MLDKRPRLLIIVESPLISRFDQCDIIALFAYWNPICLLLSVFDSNGGRVEATTVSETISVHNVSK